uniref:Reverse transcriptase n=1 Tax=Strongyloides venezuelensis TaxID=75913 RepID=A0A0K0FJB4_STRVS
MDCKCVNPYEPSYLITVYKNPDILKSNSFFDKIYERVWLGRADSYFKKLANEQASENCLRKPILFGRYSRIRYLGTIFPVKLAYQIITKMYDRFLISYDWHAKRQKSKYDRNAQILW